jgi:AcrR family transcriptional regulator
MNEKLTHTSGVVGSSRYQARKDQILDVALSAFRHKGYAGTSMQDIGRALERTKGSLYYYFPDKEEILFRCHERALDHIHAVARTVRRTHVRPEVALRELIERHVAIMIEEFHGTALALELGALSGPRLAAVVRRRDQYERILRATIARGVRSRAFRRADPKLAAFAILGSINWIARWYRPTGRRRAAEVGRVFADLFMSGLETPRRPRPRPRPARAGRPRPGRAARRR